MIGRPQLLGAGLERNVFNGSCMLAGHGVISPKWELLNFLLAFVNSNEPRVQSSKKMDITSLWPGGDGGGGGKRPSLALFLPFHSKFHSSISEILANCVSVSFFPPSCFFVCWQSRNRKVCRVFWVSVQDKCLVFCWSTILFCKPLFWIRLPSAWP